MRLSKRPGYGDSRVAEVVEPDESESVEDATEVESEENETGAEEGAESEDESPDDESE